jgi:hypothetical protein
MMKNRLTTSMFLIGLSMTGGCASNLSQSLSPSDAMTIPDTRVADGRSTQAADLVTTNMKAAVIVVGLSEMSRLADSARGQPN